MKSQSTWNTSLFLKKKIKEKATGQMQDRFSTRSRCAEHDIHKLSVLEMTDKQLYKLIKH